MAKRTVSITPQCDSKVSIRQTLAELAQQTAAFFQKGAEGAVNTQSAYRSDIEQLTQWLRLHDLGVLPISPATLAAYVSAEAAVHKWATLSRRLAAIRKWHRTRKHPDPAADEAVKIVLEGIKRTIGTEPEQAPAFDIDEFKRSVRAISSTSAGLRDRALLLICFAGAFRRSELVALDIEGIQFTREGAVLSYQGSKTNQYGKREEKALFFSPDPETCPVRALEDYLNLLNRTQGPLFVRIRKGEQITDERLSDKQVARTTKRYLGEDYSAHSHRASFVTIAKLNGADDSQIMQQTKHRTRTMIDRYTRVQEVVKHNAAMKLGL